MLFDFTGDDTTAVVAEINNRQEKIMSPFTKDDAWDKLIQLGVSEQTLQIVTCINGYTIKTMEDVLDAHTGYKCFTQV